MFIEHGDTVSATIDRGQHAQTLGNITFYKLSINGRLERTLIQFFTATELLGHLIEIICLIKFS